MSVRPAIPKKLSIGEETLAQQLKAYKIPFTREVHFAYPRRFRFDFALHPAFSLAHKIAVEVDGGTYHGKSRHSFGKGYEKDCEKMNLAAAKGWTVFKFTTRQVTSGEAIKQILEYIKP